MIRQFLNTFRYAINGIVDGFVSQKNMKIHALISIAVLVAGWFFHISILEFCLLLFAIGLVIGLELMNTAVEYVVNLVSPDYHSLAGKAKDVAAGAVLFAAIIAVLIGLLVFGTRVWNWVIGNFFVS